jgi:hypothetical protein
LAIRPGKRGECVINRYGDAELVRDDTDHLLCIIRKIEVPKKYRPFANGEEFKPHRDRWWMLKDVPPELVGSRGVFAEPPEAYAEQGFAGCDWKEAFELRVFDDGTPFGVEVTE